jgi:hypothetical protein
MRWVLWSNDSRALACLDMVFVSRRAGAPADGEIAFTGVSAGPP